MSMGMLRNVRQGIAPAILWLGMGSVWAQTEEIAARIESLEPTKQNQLQVLMESRAVQDGPRLPTDEEVRVFRNLMPTRTTPLLRVEVEELSRRINNVYGSLGNVPFRIVNDDSVFPVCQNCDDGIGRTCHKSSSQTRRQAASSLLKRSPHLTEAVGSLYLIREDSPSELIGTVFVLQGRIVTNHHVLFELTQGAGLANVRKLKPGRRLEAVFGGSSGRKVALPTDANWHRHPTLDLILTQWPGGVEAPPGLTLSMNPLTADTLVALLGFPSINTSTDRTEDINTVFGRCPDASDFEPHMVISMGRIASVSNAHLEHDANTMGNSSGSPLVRMADGALVGVHSGDALSSVRNSAVAANALVELLKVVAP